VEAGHERERQTARASLVPPRFAGLVRPRLVGQIASKKVTLIRAPAGFGKTTLLVHFVAEHAHESAWVSLGSKRADPPRMLDLLYEATRAALGGAPRWSSVDDAIQELDTRTDRLLIAIDDAHLVADPATMSDLDALISDTPDSVRFAIATRRDVPIDLHALRLHTDVIELQPEDLRFRTWEVEELFRDVHGVALRPEDVAELTRRTVGWPAGLQLFHLATNGQPRSVRVRVMSGLGTRERLSREFLTAHVLDVVTPSERDFMVRSSVFDTLTGARCDALLGTSDGETILASLAARGLFTFATPDGQSYEFHDLLRAYLLDVLERESGPQATRALHRRAAQILEEENSLTEALRAYCRSEDWEDVRRLIGDRGAALASATEAWFDDLPAFIRDHDPWVLLAIARSLVASGSFERAYDFYARAIDALPSADRGRAGDERRELAAWLEPERHQSHTPLGAARALLRGSRPSVASSNQEPITALLVAAFELLEGDLDHARSAFADIALRDDVSPVIEAAALLGRAFAATLVDTNSAGPELDEATMAAKILGAPFLTRLARTVSVLAGSVSAGEVAALRDEARADDDVWCDALLTLANGARTDDAGALADAAARFDALRSDRLSEWAAVACALAPPTADVPPHVRARLDWMARHADGPLRRVALQLLGPGAIRPNDKHEHEIGTIARLVTALRAAATDPIPAERAAALADADQAEPRAGLRITCFGTLTLEIGPDALRLESVRPRTLRLLELLCINANRDVHSDRLIEHLWPESPDGRGAHRLQVAISELRRLLQPGAPPRQSRYLARHGDAYRLVLASDDDADVRRVERDLETLAHALGDEDPDELITLCARLLEDYRGKLLPSAADEWIASEREYFCRRVATMCAEVSQRLDAAGRSAEVVNFTRAGLAIDPYADRLWQLLIAALDRLGEPMAATAARNDYAARLAELGVD
jgi:DNA-binding SARP family transcriptional activator